MALVINKNWAINIQGMAAAVYLMPLQVALRQKS